MTESTTTTDKTPVTTPTLGGVEARSAALDLARTLRRPVSGFTPDEATALVEDLGSHRAVANIQRAVVADDAATPPGYETGAPGVLSYIARHMPNVIRQAEELLDALAAEEERVRGDSRLSRLGQEAELERVRKVHAEKLRSETGAKLEGLLDLLTQREAALRKKFSEKSEDKPDPNAELVQELRVLAVLSAARPFGADGGALLDLVGEAAKQGSSLTPALLEVASLAIRDPLRLHALVAGVSLRVGAIRRAALLASQPLARAAIELHLLADLRKRVETARLAITRASSSADLATLLGRWKRA